MRANFSGIWSFVFSLDFYVYLYGVCKWHTPMSLWYMWPCVDTPEQDFRSLPLLLSVCLTMVKLLSLKQRLAGSAKSPGWWAFEISPRLPLRYEVRNRARHSIAQSLSPESGGRGHFNSGLHNYRDSVCCSALWIWVLLKCLSIWVQQFLIETENKATFEEYLPPPPHILRFLLRDNWGPSNDMKLLLFLEGAARFFCNIPDLCPQWLPLVLNYL